MSSKNKTLKTLDRDLPTHPLFERVWRGGQTEQSLPVMPSLQLHWPLNS